MAPRRSASCVDSASRRAACSRCSSTANGLTDPIWLSSRRIRRSSTSSSCARRAPRSPRPGPRRRLRGAVVTPACVRVVLRPRALEAERVQGDLALARQRGERVVVARDLQGGRLGVRDRARPAAPLAPDSWRSRPSSSVRSRSRCASASLRRAADCCSMLRASATCSSSGSPLGREHGELSLGLGDSPLERLAPHEQLGDPAARSDRSALELVGVLTGAQPCFSRLLTGRRRRIALLAGPSDAGFMGLTARQGRIVRPFEVPASSIESAKLGELGVQPLRVGQDALETTLRFGGLASQAAGLRVGRVRDVLRPRPQALGRGCLGYRGQRQHRPPGCRRVRASPARRRPGAAGPSAGRRAARRVGTSTQRNEAAPIGQISLGRHGRPSRREVSPPGEQRSKVGRHRDPREDARDLLAANPLGERPSRSNGNQRPLPFGRLGWPTAVEQPDGAARVGRRRARVGLAPEEGFAQLPADHGFDRRPRCFRARLRHRPANATRRPPAAPPSRPADPFAPRSRPARPAPQPLAQPWRWLASEPRPPGGGSPRRRRVPRPGPPRPSPPRADRDPLASVRCVAAASACRRG